MRYLAGLLILFFGFVGISAAQGRGHGGGSHGGQGAIGGQKHGPAQFHPEGHGNNARPVRPSERPDHFRGDGGHHASDRDRWHYDGRHFDRGWHERHFGERHRFWIGRPVFYGGEYRFWYGGFWFSYAAWPGDWCYCDQVYIDYDEDTDCYFLYNPYHPGFRMRIVVVF